MSQINTAGRAPRTLIAMRAWLLAAVLAAGTLMASSLSDPRELDDLLNYLESLH